MFEHGSIGLWVLQLTVTIAFTIMAIWMYRKARMENADKRWFKFIFGSSEWASVMKAMNFLKGSGLTKKNKSATCQRK